MPRYPSTYDLSYSFGPGPLPPAIRALIIANAVMFVIRLIFPDITLYLGLIPSAVFEQLRLWQPLTYMFLHSGLFHILFNMLALWMFGCDLERRWGSPFFLKYFTICVAGGGLLNALLLPNQTGPSIGASAGIYGLLLAYALLYPNRIIYFYFLFPLKMKHFVMIIGAISLYSSIAATGSGIAHLAHLGGMAFGYVYLRWGNPWIWAKIHWDRYRLQRRRRRLRIVERDEDDTKPTLH
jgi:membrane associated rhomboid family serine protease